MNPSTARRSEHRPPPVERMLAGIDPDDVPTAGVDPIDSRSEAIAAVSLVVSRPLRSETVVLTLDARRRGLGMVAIDGTDDSHSIGTIAAHLDTVIALADSAQHALGISRDPTELVVIITIDPTGALPAHLPGEIDRLCSAAGVGLLDWLVLGPECVTPMVDDRWPRSASAAQPE